MFRFLACFAFCALFQVADSAQITPRITEPANESRLVALTVNTHPMALPPFDLGAAPAVLALARMHGCCLEVRCSHQQSLLCLKLSRRFFHRASTNG